MTAKETIFSKRRTSQQFSSTNGWQPQGNGKLQRRRFHKNRSIETRPFTKVKQAKPVSEKSRNPCMRVTCEAVRATRRLNTMINLTLPDPQYRCPGHQSRRSHSHSLSATAAADRNAPYRDPPQPPTVITLPLRRPFSAVSAAWLPRVSSLLCWRNKSGSSCLAVLLQTKFGLGSSKFYHAKF